jgi:hypothetical protein
MDRSLAKAHTHHGTQSMTEKHYGAQSAQESPLVSLSERYGLVMTAQEAAKELRFKSLGALRMACKRGAVNLHPLKIPGRRGLLFSTAEVAQLLATWLTSGQNQRETTM